MTVRRRSREIRVGHMMLGGITPIAVQSMTNTVTCDFDATLEQVKRLEAAGCDIVRLTAPDIESTRTFARLKEAGVRIPLVADIHFDYKIALEAIACGADKIRINPGNIGEEWKIKEVADRARAAGVPIRIGVNSGSLEKHLLQKYGSPTSEALVESGLYHASLLEKFDFTDIVISIKASSVKSMIDANIALAAACDYPIHLGVTEAGSLERGKVKSAVGIGAVLAQGIGDTLRVSLTADPVKEVEAAREILSALDLNELSGMDIVSCPTCGRTKIDLISLVSRFEDAARKEGLLGKNIKVALMGCAVNGPGEAREADIGIAGGKGEALLFAHGEIIRKIPEKDIISALIEEIKEM